MEWYSFCYNITMTASDWIALLTGIYASIVATTALIWNILRERRKVKVNIRYGYGVGGLEGQQILAIEVVNNGPQPINIQEVGFIISTKQKLINPNSPLNLG